MQLTQERATTQCRWLQNLTPKKRNRCFWSAVEKSILQGSWPRPLNPHGQCSKMLEINPTVPAGSPLNQTTLKCISSEKKKYHCFGLTHEIPPEFPQMVKYPVPLKPCFNSKIKSVSISIKVSFKKLKVCQTEIRCLQNSQTGWKRRHQQRPYDSP